MAATTVLFLSENDTKVRWGEPYVSEALNRKASVIPRGIYRGFNLSTNAIPLTVQLLPDAMGEHLAVYDSLTGYSLTIRKGGGSIPVDLTAFAGQTVFIALYAIYAQDVTTVAEIRVYTTADYNSAPEKPELVVFGSVVVPVAGVISASAILFASRTLLQSTNFGWDTPHIFSKIDQDFSQTALGASGVSITADQDTIPHTYKLLHAYRLSQTTQVRARIYSKTDPVGERGLVFTINARWGGGSNQTWIADDVASRASKTLYLNNGVDVRGKLVTAAPWIDTAWSLGEAEISIGNATITQGDVPLGAAPRLRFEEATVPTRTLLLQSRVSSAPANIYMRVYSQGGVYASVNGAFEVTVNAKWDGTSLWIPDNTTLSATRFQMGGQSGAKFHLKLQPQGVSWPDAGWIAGNAFLEVDGEISCIDLEADGDVEAVGNVIAGGNVEAGASVIGNDFYYPGVVPSFNTQSNVLNTEGYNVFKSPLPEWVYDAIDGTLRANGVSAWYTFSIKKPEGAILDTIRIAYRNNIARAPGFEAICNIIVKDNYDYSLPPAFPAFSAYGGGPFIIPGTLGNTQLAISGLALNANPGDSEIMFQVISAGTDDKILGVRVEWADPGPRNL